VAPRSDDPRRSAERGSAAGRRTTERGGLADARRYSPRGRTVRESAEAAHRGDPFRPALQVLQGGQSARTPARKAEPARRSEPAKPVKKTAQARKAAPAKKAAPVRKAAAKKSPAALRKAAARPLRHPVRRTVPLPRPGDPVRRLRVATVLMLAVFLLIAGRLVLLQLTDAPAYAARGLEERLVEESIAAPRGQILDRSGAILVHSVEARLVYADPTMIKPTEVDLVADSLAPLLGRVGISRSQIVPKLQQKVRSNGKQVMYERIARGVDIGLAEEIKRLNLPGIGIERDERREVPGHDLAANLLGFTDHDLRGAAGIEASYDATLRGVDGWRKFERGDGRLNRRIPTGYSEEQPARPGTSVQLTIHRDIQFAVQQILAAQMETVKATIGAAVVLDIRTGEIMAQASYPSYDAADPFRITNKDAYRDAASGLVVDPGSGHKAIVFSAALQEGVVRPDTVIGVGPLIRKGDRDFVDYAKPNRVETPMSLPGILAYSSNVGTIKIADLLGPEKLYEYQLKFGLGKVTDCGLAGEAPGLVQPPKNWSGTSRGSIPIGNGVAVTPLQMAAVYATIANNGKWVQPHLVRATVDAKGKTKPVPAVPSRQVVDPVHARDLRHMLEAVVSVKGATGTRAAVQGYRVAGKTGTGARVVDGRYTNTSVGSFIGMAPAEDPRFVVAVFADAPDLSGGALGPAFRDMMAFTLGHFKVPPSTEPAPTFVLYP